MVYRESLLVKSYHNILIHKILFCIQKMKGDTPIKIQFPTFTRIGDLLLNKTFYCKKYNKLWPQTPDRWWVYSDFLKCIAWNSTRLVGCSSPWNQHLVRVWAKMLSCLIGWGLWRWNGGVVENPASEIMLTFTDLSVSTENLAFRRKNSNPQLGSQLCNSGVTTLDGTVLLGQQLEKDWDNQWQYEQRKEQAQKSCILISSTTCF